MNQKSTPRRKIIKPRILGIAEAIGAALLIECLQYFPRIFGVETKALLANWLPLSIFLLLFPISSFLVLYIYKYHVVNKALLEINPHFYEEREYSKWWDYYAKQEEKHK